ncbi:hypothetical protein NAT51_05475 [Flavobacterium amniphilum]|uniref:toxin-antitoxin system YwqK family antitoxin n=1 Tax=Flavobacterium amniphilum TaxID=1834035 RepID=UPI00202A41F1|nr:hypothetical protein [Flavobacterium amniphilum]MCL9804957.1 hypothetical protein [Flavobacterium amniphilum]
MKKTVILSLVFLLSMSCKEEVRFDLKVQNQMVKFSEEIFGAQKIDSKKVLGSIKDISTVIYQDTSASGTNPAPTIYSNPSGNCYFKVYERPKGMIYGISFFKNNTEITSAEYHDNGQVQCQFKVDKKGIKNGTYNCFHRNGKIRKKGTYLNGKESGIETVYDSIGNKTSEFDYKSMKYID